MISDEQKEKYLADRRAGREVCPHCHSTDLTTRWCDSVEGDLDDPAWADSLYVRRQCADCGQEWDDVYCYRLVAVDNIDTPN